MLDKMKTRRSIRKFKSDMIPKEIIEKIVEAGTYAASGMNRQPGIIVAVTNKELRDKLSKMNADIMGAGMDPFYGAPVVLIVLADKSAPTYLFLHRVLRFMILCLKKPFLINHFDFFSKTDMKSYRTC